MAVPSDSAPAGRKKSFRVIIVGGGIGGLALSLALQKIGVEHVLLEKGEIAPPWGASISLWAQGSRIMQQLGCLDDLQKTSLPLKNMVTRTKDGKALADAPLFEQITECNGYEFSCYDRQKLLQIMYDQIPDKAYIQTKRCVSNVIESKDGVRVEMTDGTIEEGDVVIGCDGVHSTVRELMWRNANANAPDYITVKEKTSLVTTFTGLFGISKTIPGLPMPGMTCVSNDRRSFLILTQPDRTYFCVYSKLPQQSSWPNRLKYTKEDTERAAAALADHPVSESLVFGEIWKNCIRGQLVPMEEGIFSHWHFGRTALIGDSAHKVTSLLALGANNTLEGVAVLTNEINRMVKNLKVGDKPSIATISTMFNRYQEQHQPRMKISCDMANAMTRLQTCDGLINRINMLYVLPYKGFDVFVQPLATMFAGAAKFDFIPLEYNKTATVKWKDEAIPGWVNQEASEGKVGEIVSEIRKNGTLLIGTACVVLLSVIVWL